MDSTMPAPQLAEVRGTRLAYRDTGDGQAFVWGHGLLGSMVQEDETGLFGWPDVARSGRLVRYDARGHGDSVPAPRNPDDFTFASHAADMLGLLDVLDIDDAVLGGASLGSATALHAAVQAPERARGLVLVIPPTAWDTRGRQQRIYTVGARLVEIFGLRPFATLLQWAPKPALATGDLEPVWDAMLGHIGRNDRTITPSILRGAAASDLPAPDQLRSLDVPALVLTWRGDRTHPVSTSKRLDQLLPGSRLHVAEQASDVWEWPDRIEDFLSETSTSTSTSTSGG